jgi:hypothetical protein
VSATSLKPLFAGDTPAPRKHTQAKPFGSRRWPGARLPRPMPRSG